MKKLLIAIGCFISLSLMAGNPVLEAHVCQADKFLAGCDVFQRTDGDQAGVPVDIGGVEYSLNLTWGTPAEFPYSDSIAVGGKYIFNCQVLDGPGEYRDTLVTATGCDSIVVLTLTEYTPVPPCKDTTVEYTDSVAVGGKYIFNCQVLTEAGTYTETLTKADGCDSIVVLTLTEYTPVPPCVPTTGDTTAYVCQGDDFYWHGTIAVDGDTWTTTNVAGCDSVVTLHIIDLLPTTGDTTAYVCQGEEFIWHGQPGVEGAIWTTTNVAGCDSVVTLHVIELLPTTGDTTATVCQGERLIWHGKAAKDGLTWTTTNAAGCDSIVTLHLTVLQPSYGDTTAYVCQYESYFWHGEWVANTATWKTTNAVGCDSIVTLHVEKSPTWVDDLPAYAKDNDWLLMIDRKQLREQYDMEPTEDQVHWYKKRVNGFIFLGTGYYFTNGQPLEGDYYARLVGIDLSPLGSCVAEARTITLHCGTEARALTLAPTMVGAGEPMVLSNLDATQESTIVIYNAAGSAMRSFRVQGTETFHLNAEETSGIYLMHVENAHQSTTLKFIVNQ